MSDDQKLKFLCFRLGDRVFALDIMGIREILRTHPVTPVPDAPEQVRGVMNVRGELMTVLDARKILGVVFEDPAQRDVRIIIGSMPGGRFGILVDAVLEVVAVGIDEIEPAPSGPDTGSGAVLGIFRRAGESVEEVVVLLRLGALAKYARGETAAP